MSKSPDLQPNFGPISSDQNNDEAALAAADRQQGDPVTDAGAGSFADDSRPRARTRGVIGRPFPKGVSGNPAGSSKTFRKLVELARSHTPEAVETLVKIMRDRKTPAVARVRAITEIIDRAYGKAPQELKIDADLEVRREPLSSVELARRVWFALHGGHELDPSRAIDTPVLASPDAIPASVEHEPSPAVSAQPAASTQPPEVLHDDEEEFG